MKKRTGCMLFLIWWFGTVAWAGQMPPLTLNQAVIKALEVHPAVKADKMAYKAQKHAALQARSGLYPSIDISSQTGYERAHNSLTRTRQASGTDSADYRDLVTNTQTLSLTQLLWDGNMTRSRYQAQTHRVESSRILAKNSADDIALQTIESYMNVLRARKILRLAEDNILALDSLADKTIMRLDSGKGTITDVNRVKLTLSDARSNRVNQLGKLQNARNRFRALTGSDADLIVRQQTIRFDRIIPTVEEALDRAMANNKAIGTAQSNIRQKEADLETAKGRWQPKVSLILQGIREENVEALKDVDYTASGNIRVDFNLFRGWADQAAVTENASLLAEARAREQEIRLDVETRIRHEFTNIWTAEKKIRLLEKKIEQDVKILENYEEQFLVGKRDILDVIDAQKMLFVFQSALEDVETDRTLARFRLLTLMGNLFDALDIDFNPDA